MNWSVGSVGLENGVEKGDTGDAVGKNPQSANSATVFDEYPSQVIPVV